LNDKLKDLFVWSYHPDIDQVRIDGIESTDLPKDWRISSITLPEMSKFCFKLVDDRSLQFWNREPLLITADFVQQADNEHLGYTGCEYQMLKQYEIKRNTPYFTIALWEDGTMNPVELPSDNKDIVVVEATIQRTYDL
jgi:hypothetical protein